MSVTFNADEVLTLAMKIERNGARFYYRASENMPTPSAKSLFKGLAVLEETHEKTFAAMKTELSDQERTETVFDPENQNADYLQALANGRVFDIHTDPVTKLTGRESLRDIIILAIGMEKDSIIFYLGMKEIVPPQLGKNRIDAIIKEEMRHITVLSQELAMLEK
ncbi:MAG: ferritin family protein [Phycisphaerae bacterium]